MQEPPDFGHDRSHPGSLPRRSSHSTPKHIAATKPVPSHAVAASSFSLVGIAVRARRRKLKEEGVVGGREEKGFGGSEEVFGGQWCGELEEETKESLQSKVGTQRYQVLISGLQRPRSQVKPGNTRGSKSEASRSRIEVRPKQRPNAGKGELGGDGEGRVRSKDEEEEENC
ncbi:hypothetical protein Droror1_Dr00009804 [Drosera rotundifolia]